MQRYSLRSFIVLKTVASIAACFSIAHLMRLPDPDWHATIGGPSGFALTKEVAQVALNHSAPVYAPDINTPIEITNMEQIVDSTRILTTKFGLELECTTYRCNTRSISGNKQHHVMLIEHQTLKSN